MVYVHMTQRIGSDVMCMWAAGTVLILMMDANTLRAVVSGAVAGAVTAIGALNVPRSDPTYVDIKDVAIGLAGQSVLTVSGYHR